MYVFRFPIHLKKRRWEFRDDKLIFVTASSRVAQTKMKEIEM